MSAIVERRSLRGGPTRPARNPHRWWALVLAVLLIGAGITTAGVITAPPAQAGFMGLCDADTSFPIPAKPPRGAGPVGHVHRIEASYDRSFLAVGLPEGATSPVRQFSGAGLTWFPWGHSCMDAGVVADTMLANGLFETLVLWPARLLGVMLDAGYGTGLVDALLNVAEPVVTSLSEHVFLQWAPVMIMFVLIGATWKAARGRGRQAFSQIAWMAAVTAIVTGLLTTGGISLLRDVNRYISHLTACVTFGTTAVGCEAGGEAGRLDYSSAMVDSLAADTWAHGMLGDRAVEPAPKTLTITQRHDAFPRLQDSWEVPVPVDAVPAAKAGAPTWGELLRWTQTYTTAELRHMQDDAAARCTMNPQQSPSIQNVTNGPNHHQHLSEDELCSLKWLVRAGIVAELVEDDPDSLATFRGEGAGRVPTALAAAGIAPLAVGIGVIAALVLVLQLELVLLVVAAPVVALFALRDPRMGRRWGEAILATIVKRIAMGLTLGLVLWAMNGVAAAVRSIGWVGLMAPAGTTVLTIAIMVAGVQVLRRIQGMLLTTVQIEDAPGAVESGAKKVALTGVAAASGALTAGSGMMLAGALRGAGRAGLFGASNLRGAFSAGAQGGTAARIANAVGNPRPTSAPPGPTPPPPGPHPDPGPGPGPDGPPPSDPPSDAPPADPTPGADGPPPAGPDALPVDPVGPDVAPSSAPDAQDPGPGAHPRVQMDAAWGRVIAHPAIAPVVAGHAERAEARRDQLAHEADRLRQLLDHERERAEQLGDEAAAAAERAGQDPEQARREAVEQAYREQVGPVRAAVERAEQAVADAVSAARAASQGAGALEGVQQRLLAGEDPAALAAELGGDDDLAGALAAWVDAVRDAGYGGPVEYED